jgi:hypothetical protein
MGWWRRNCWGLVGLVPAAAVILALTVEGYYYRVYAGQPRQPIAAEADGRYVLGDAHIRLVELAPVTDLKTYSGEPFTPPANVAIWRARIEFDAPAEPQIGGCVLTAEDERGRVYDDDPTHELRGAAGVVGESCLAPYDATGPSRYVNSVYFALPRNARVVAIRISLATRLPRYVRLTPG